MVTIWDDRIKRDNPDAWKINLKRSLPEYYLTDINKKLRNTEVKVYLNWNHMATIGP
jgi:hypothetical protein